MGRHAVLDVVPSGHSASAAAFAVHVILDVVPSGHSASAAAFAVHVRPGGRGVRLSKPQRGHRGFSFAGPEGVLTRAAVLTLADLSVAGDACTYPF